MLFLALSSDPQKYKGYDREGSDNRHKRDKCHHKAAQYKEYQESDVPYLETDIATGGGIRFEDILLWNVHGSMG